MKYPNLREEKRLWRKGYKMVIGLDEAGRGPLAGPVVAAAVILNLEFRMKNLEFLKKEIKDSKQLSPQKRKDLYNVLKGRPEVEWGIGRVSEKVIDRINILEATKLAMKRAVKNLEKKLKKGSAQKIRDRGFFAKDSFLVIDGNFGIDLSLSQRSIIKGDEKVFSCAAASILAKVSRDKMMSGYHKKYPQYGFDRHKGYPTEYHREMLKKYGPCRIHRISFGRVSVLKNL